MSDGNDNSNELNLNTKHDETALNEIDEFLAASAPDFLKEISDIKIDNSKISLSVFNENADYSDLEGQPVPYRKITIKEKAVQVFDIRSNFKLVISFWLSIVLIFIGIYAFLQPNFWDQKSSLFLTSFAALGVPVESFNPDTDTQYFFENPRLPKNLVALKKMTINLKSSNGSNDRSMLAFEISIEGITQEVVVEIKDRESEFVDLVSRTAEDFTYGDLSSTEGKQLLSQKILEQLNSNLTKGKIRKVMYASFILKN